MKNKTFRIPFFESYTFFYVLLLIFLFYVVFSALITYLQKILYFNQLEIFTVLLIALAILITLIFIAIINHSKNGIEILNGWMVINTKPLTKNLKFLKINLQNVRSIEYIEKRYISESWIGRRRYLIINTSGRFKIRNKYDDRKILDASSYCNSGLAKQILFYVKNNYPQVMVSSIDLPAGLV